MSAASSHINHSRRTAVLVMNADARTTLCPFFGKCDGLLLIDPDTGFREFYANTEHTAEGICDVILDTGVERLVLGFVPSSAARKLRAAGIDVRLGSCVCAVEDLAVCFDALPVLQRD